MLHPKARIWKTALTRVIATPASSRTDTYRLRFGPSALKKVQGVGTGSWYAAFLRQNRLIPKCPAWFGNLFNLAYNKRLHVSALLLQRSATKIIFRN